MKPSLEPEGMDFHLFIIMDFPIWDPILVWHKGLRNIMVRFSSNSLHSKLGRHPNDIDNMTGKGTEKTKRKSSI